MSSALVFQSTTFDVIDHNGQIWIRGAQIGSALGYSDPAKKIHELYTRHADEFTKSMTQVIEILDTPTLGQGSLVNKVRVFSLRGCHLLAMFARTTVAKAFRVWVLDVLETLNRAQSVTNCHLLESTAAPSTADERAPLRALVHAWAQMSGIAHQALWPQVKAHFQLSRIDDLPREWIPDALAFVQGKIDALQGIRPKALPAPEPQPDYVRIERNRTVKERIAEVRGLRNKYYDASDQLETMLAKDEIAMALKIISITSGFALLDRYEELAVR